MGRRWSLAIGAAIAGCTLPAIATAQIDWHAPRQASKPWTRQLQENIRESRKDDAGVEGTEHFSESIDGRSYEGSLRARAEPLGRGALTRNGRASIKIVPKGGGQATLHVVVR